MLKNPVVICLSSRSSMETYQDLRTQR